MVVLRIDSKDGTPLGMINWFAVHPTSMNNTNQLVSGDNKGYASQLFEKEMNPNDRMGTGKFVAAFASSNLGDVSPNIKGPKCIDTGEECDYNHSTCNNFTQNCIAFGPGDNMKASTGIVARRQYEAAKEIFHDETTRVNVHGSIKYTHQYINMTNQQVTITENGQPKIVTTCPGALGFSFAAGTTDGPGAFDFTQGDTNGNPFWSLIRDMLRAPSQQQLSCQHPKPILLDVGETHFPYDWVPAIVETQMIKIGNVYLIGFPGELTTMSGRRMRNAVKKIADEIGPESDSIAIVAGLTNVYTHYVATFEEYQMQRYEAASTLYGPHTLSAYIQQYSLLTRALITNSAVEDGPNPPLLIKGQISFNPPIVMDMPPFLRKMGECIREPYPLAYPGDTIKVTFIAGHPRNNPLRGGTFFLVERKPEESSTVSQGGGKYAKWETVATDADWSTEFRWVRPVPLLPNSEIDFTWEIPEDLQKFGTYRIRHFGYYKPLLRDPLPYTGSTIEFEVRPMTTVAAVLYRRPALPVKNQKIRTIGDFWNALSGNSWPERDLKADRRQSVFGSSAFMR
ncbi:unnamed protein product [Allacma fusca]|uniref:Neutral ceramidase n=1 Tax=Allacma fusca TaxID=39272 RepID=A0A8J2LRJ5_9HEXA|nr:unnamed protein product [Allacma fusca]